MIMVDYLLYSLVYLKTVHEIKKKLDQRKFIGQFQVDEARG